MYRCLAVVMASCLMGTIATAQTPEELQTISAACPAAAPAKPAKPRKVLVFTLTRGFRHDSIPFGVAAMKALGEKTGAFAVTHSEDAAVFEKPSLDQFDAVIMLNTTGEVFRPAEWEKLAADKLAPALDVEKRLKQNLTDFVEGGKGLVGIHSATDTFYQFSWYGQAIGGYFDGHPWGAGDDVVIRVDDPEHPVAKPLEGKSLEFKEEIYQLRDPYSRDKQRVLLTLDQIKTNLQKPGVKRTDSDFGVSWVRAQGKGRVFYCSLGHNAHIYMNPRVLGHYLAGIQFAIGDLPAETKPIPMQKPEKAKQP